MWSGSGWELLREVVPGVHRLAIMANVGNPQNVSDLGEVQTLARTLGILTSTLEIRQSEDNRAGVRAAGEHARTRFT
jgi:putative tryptophan/tyrosine transport system substrate-binding protein